MDIFGKSEAEQILFLLMWFNGVVRITLAFVHFDKVTDNFSNLNLIPAFNEYNLIVQGVWSEARNKVFFVTTFLAMRKHAGRYNQRYKNYCNQDPPHREYPS